MSEVSESEYRAKQREIAKYEQEINVCKKEIKSVEDQIAEMDRAIEQMTGVDEAFGKEVKELMSLMAQDFEFQGEQYDKLLMGEGTRILTMAEGARKSPINHALDEMEWLRNDLRKQRNAKYGLLGKLKSLLSSGWTWLKTHFFN